MNLDDALETFILECRELLEDMETALLSVEQAEEKDELVIWMSSTAMKAPSMPAATATQVRRSTCSPTTAGMAAPRTLCVVLVIARS